MRVFHVRPGTVIETGALPGQAPDSGFYWVALGRREFEVEQAHIHAMLHDVYPYHTVG